MQQKSHKGIQQKLNKKGGVLVITLKDNTTPGSNTAPDFITTPSHIIACLMSQPSSIVTLSHI